jgi:hypothetical protein
MNKLDGKIEPVFSETFSDQEPPQHPPRKDRVKLGVSPSARVSDLEYDEEAYHLIPKANAAHSTKPCVRCYPEHCLCEGKTCWCDPSIHIIEGVHVTAHREVR